jgi:hypothetical protein
MPAASTEPSLEKLRSTINDLNNPSFRTRQLAVWYLEQNAARALPLLREAGRTTDLNIGAEVVAILSDQAMQGDPTISVAAHEALKEIAGGQRSITAVSHLAHTALAGIADRQEILARQALEGLRVELGNLRLTIGGSLQNSIGAEPSSIVRVTSDFAGTDDDIRLFRFLRSYDTAYLEGNKLNEKLLREVLTMPGLKRIVLKGSAVNNQLLTALFDVPSLEHLELVYANVDDTAIDTIVDLPLVDSLRVFGTRISMSGAKRIKQELEGLDIYFGRGGFLGVQTQQNDLRVQAVVSGSGAELGGIQTGDLITHVNQKAIKTFTQLREELANFAEGEQVAITIERPTLTGDNRPFEGSRQLELQITLGKQESVPN